MGNKLQTPPTPPDPPSIDTIVAAENNISEHELTAIANKLVDAASHGDATRLKSLLEIGINVDFPNSNGETAMSVACEKGNIEVVQLLLGHRADLSKTAGHRHNIMEQRTPLYFASARGDERLATLLINRGADINQRDKSGFTALHAACSKYAGSGIVSLLLDRGADPNLPDDGGRSPCHIACRDRSVPVMRLMHQHKANFNAMTKDGRNCMQLICQSNYGFGAGTDKLEECIDLLIRWGVKVNDAGTNGWTALHNVCRNGNLEAAKHLVNYHADINIAALDGRTPLHCACCHADSKTARYLLTLNVNISAQNKNGWTALHYACSREDMELAKVLIENGIDVGAVTKEGLTASELVQDRGKRERLEADINELMCGLK